jgi:hypothetical protein
LFSEYGTAIFAGLAEGLCKGLGLAIDLILANTCGHVAECSMVLTGVSSEA